MNILWFECTTPGPYKGNGAVLGGWQDSLEQIVRTIPDITLTVSFELPSASPEKTINGVRYVPISLSYTNEEKKRASKSLDVYTEKLVSAMLRVVEDVKPDVIHIFGTEWAYGLVAEHTNIPVVIHIQGAIVPYNNADLPPRYSIIDVIRNEGLRRPIAMYRAWKRHKYELMRETIERRVWKAVPNYMGRTEWDKGLSAVLHPGRRYFHVDEALRPQFLTGENKWQPPTDGKIKLISTGIISFRKGIDMMLKVAEILKSLNFDFEWHIAGVLPPNFVQIVERKEGRTFRNCNIIVHGFLQGVEVFRLLSQSTMYIHTAYAENSPNSICEAQCIGIPVISTNVGGISTLVHDREDGILVPANDPWQMAYQIIELSKDVERMKLYSQKAQSRSLQRHNPDTIMQQLLDCYESITEQQ